MVGSLNYFRSMGDGRYVARPAGFAMGRGVQDEMIPRPGLPSVGGVNPLLPAYVSDARMPVVSVGGVAGSASRPAGRAPAMPQGASGRLAANKRAAGARAGASPVPVIRGEDLYPGQVIDPSLMLGVPGGGDLGAVVTESVPSRNPLLGGAPAVDSGLGVSPRKTVNTRQNPLVDGDQTSAMMSNPLNDPRFMTPAQGRIVADAQERKRVVESRRDAAIAAMQGIRTRLADGSAEREGRAMAGEDQAAMSALSRGGYNPLVGLGAGSGVMRNGVYTPSGGVTDFAGTAADQRMAEYGRFLDAGQVARNAEYDAIQVAKNAELDRTAPERRYAALRRYGMDPEGRSVQPNSPEALIAGRTDLTPEQKAAFLTARADKKEERALAKSEARQRQFARAQFRRGEVFGTDGQIDAGASALARVAQVNPLLAANMGVQQEANQNKAFMDQQQLEMADRELKLKEQQFAAENPLLASASDPAKVNEQRIARGIELDNQLNGDQNDQFFTTVEGLVLGSEGLDPRDQVEMLREQGIRSDHLMAVLNQNGPSVWDFMTSQEDLDRRQKVRNRITQLLQGMEGQTSTGASNPLVTPATPATPSTVVQRAMPSAGSFISAGPGGPGVFVPGPSVGGGAGTGSATPKQSPTEAAAEAIRNLQGAMAVGGAAMGAVRRSPRTRELFRSQF